MFKKRRICVIGAGASGLAAVKCALEEKATVLCYEKTGDLGGRWNCRQGIPVTDYLLSYAARFQLLRYICFQAQVLNVRQLESGFTVTVLLGSGETVEQGYDAVIVCTGRDSKPMQPSIPGLKSFPGLVIHEGDYKRLQPRHNNKRVLVVGGNQSATHIATELAISRTEHVIWASATGFRFHSRLARYGRPADVVANSARWRTGLFNLMPTGIQTLYADHKHNLRQDAALYNLAPPSAGNKALYTDTAHNSIIAGRLVLRGSVASIDGNTVLLADGSSECVDEIILATGYQTTFPYLDKDLAYKSGSQGQHLQLGVAVQGVPGLAFVGFGGPPTSLSLSAAEQQPVKYLEFMDLLAGYVGNLPFEAMEKVFKPWLDLLPKSK